MFFYVALFIVSKVSFQKKAICVPLIVVNLELRNIAVIVGIYVECSSCQITKNSHQIHYFGY